MRSGLILVAAAVLPGFGQFTREVGPGKRHASLAEVPWRSLGPGDRVLIYWRPEAYREKVLICSRGTAKAPVVVRGVPGPDGSLPVLDGNGASTPASLTDWQGGRGVVQIGNADYELGYLPRFIRIENLEIRSGRPPYSFVSAEGQPRRYPRNAAALYVQRGENITIRGCTLRDSGNGLMIGSSDRSVSGNILVEHNSIFDNGIEGSLYEHNSYTAARGITFLRNRFGRLRPGARGNNLKDRSVGLLIRDNRLEGGNRQLDLVDAEDSRILRADPRYRETRVCGNLLIEPDGEGNRQIVHYGGDSGRTAEYRKGVLFFHGNTVVSARRDHTTLFRLSTNDERCDARDNVFYVWPGGKNLALLEGTGILDLWRNWIQPGWLPSVGAFRGEIRRRRPLVELADPPAPR